jgi:hypothetical protein
VSEQEEVWTYAGLRFASNGTLAQCWGDNSGQELLFKSKSRHTIGGLYICLIVREGERVSMKGAPRYHSGVIPQGNSHEYSESQIKEWIADDAEARIRLSAKQAEKRAEDRGGLGMLTLRELKDQMRKLPASHQAGLLAAVLRYLQIRS